MTKTNRLSQLEIRVSGQRVGWLVQANGRTGVRFDDDWRNHPDRLLFSLSVEETALQDIRATDHLPTWFENLMFEGRLREWIQESEPESLTDGSLGFLARIGLDLVGAVTLHPSEGEVARPESDPGTIAPVKPARGRLRWSLAGVQLKLNLKSEGERFTMPVHGELGRFIAKFPDRNFLGVPVNEHATMQWASASGLDVAETQLIESGQVDEIPFSLGSREEPVLLVTRFDRTAEGTRVHSEEFAQALDVRPSEKYRRLGWRHHLNLVSRACPEDIAEYLRRVLFVVVSGNSDSHHKNWSFVFPDGRRPRLAPAYDQVSTVAWQQNDPQLHDSLAFKLAGSNRWERLYRHSFRRLMERAKVDSFVDKGVTIGVQSVEDWVAAELSRMKEEVDVAVAIAGQEYADAIERHWSRIPVLR